MNTLEFIDNLIKYNETQLAKYPLSGKLLDPNYKHKEADIVYKHNKYYTEQLQTLYQIKSKLEAWEVAKKVLNRFDKHLIDVILGGLSIASKINKKELKNFKKYWKEGIKDE